MLLAEAERRHGVIASLAGALRDGRAPARVKHGLRDILEARCNAIASGHPDANDLDALRDDPMIRMSAGKAPFEGDGLVSQPTMSRIENGATFRDVVRAAKAMIGVYCRMSYRQPPKSVTLDIDSAICPTYGNQEGARWSTHHDAHG